MQEVLNMRQRMNVVHEYCKNNKIKIITKYQSITKEKKPHKLCEIYFNDKRSLAGNGRGATEWQAQLNAMGAIYSSLQLYKPEKVMTEFICV